jgi:hypothetical protein
VFGCRHRRLETIVVHGDDYADLAPPRGNQYFPFPSILTTNFDDMAILSLLNCCPLQCFIWYGSLLLAEAVAGQRQGECYSMSEKVRLDKNMIIFYYNPL